MVVSAFIALNAAASGKVNAEVALLTLVEVSLGEPRVQLYVNFGGGLLPLFEFIITQKLVIPNIVDLISLLVGVLGRDRSLHLFTGRSTHPVECSNLPTLLLLSIQVGHILLQIALIFVFLLFPKTLVEKSGPLLDGLGQLPNTLIGEDIEVVVLVPGGV